ncbi:MAG: GNAT family N-acetyltransferase [Phycisphaerales bacterium JB063]
MPNLRLRPITPDDFDNVARLIVASTNHWYQQHRGHDIFTCDPLEARLFCEVYDAIDPGQGVLIEDTATGRLAGSCFVHPRPTHLALGIMNTAPDYAGKGVARRLLSHVTDLADQRKQATRLVSSAMNLDSFSLYNRAGFMPTAVYQDMLFAVPAEGLAPPALDAGAQAYEVRPATLADVEAIDALEQRIAGISRANDWRYFIEDALGVWTTTVACRPDGSLVGVLGSVVHPASAMVGPGVMLDDDAALSLMHATLNQRRGQTLVALMPSDRPALTEQGYAWGGRNCELHVTQVRGESRAARGVVMPTFMPETG